MKSNIGNYIDEYIVLCSQMCKKPEDYTRKKVKKHNIAMGKLCKLKEDMYKNSQLTEEVYSVLLKCEDAYVQQTAATECLTLNIHIDLSVKILKKIVRSGDRMSAMGAKRNLLIWESKLNPNEPF